MREQSGLLLKDASYWVCVLLVSEEIVDIFSLKETLFFGLSPVFPLAAQLQKLVAHPVG